MEQRKFQDRVRLVTGELTRFLRQYSTPPQLDTNDLEFERVRLLAEDINSEIASDLSSEGIRDKLHDTFSELRKSYRAHQWPSSAHFIDAMNKAKNRRRPAASLLADGTVSAKRSELSEEDLKLLEGTLLPRSRSWINKYHCDSNMYGHAYGFLETWEDLDHPEIQQKLADVKSYKHRRECRDSGCEICGKLNQHIPQAEIDHHNRVMAELTAINPDTPPSRAKAEPRKTVYGYTDEELMAYCRSNPTTAQPETINSLGDEK